MTAHTAIRRLFVLLCGYEIIPRAISLRGADPRFLHAVPITAYLIETAEGWVLFDTGLDPAHLEDPGQRQRLFLDRGWDPPPAVMPEHRMQRQLAAIGIGFGDIGMVVLSHLHADHTGYLKQVTNARVLIQRAEHAHGMGPQPGAPWFPEDYDHPEIGWNLLDGDAEPLPGLRLLSTPGHTVGHQSALLEMPNGPPVILAADAGDLRVNFDKEILPGEAADDAQALASIRRLMELERDTGAHVLITHDPEQIRRIPLAPKAWGAEFDG